MKRKIAQAAAALGLALILTLHSWTAPAQSEIGDKVGRLKFSDALSAVERNYLGLAKTGEFTLLDIPASYVLLEVFSTGCPHCILQARPMNRLYRLVSRDPKLRAHLKIMGLGYYEGKAALERFKLKHDVPFPLIPDSRGHLFQELKAPGTPTFMVLDTQGRVVYWHAGEFSNAKKFLREITRHLKL